MGGRHKAWVCQPGLQVESQDEEAHQDDGHGGGDEDAGLLGQAGVLGVALDDCAGHGGVEGWQLPDQQAQTDLQGSKDHRVAGGDLSILPTLALVGTAAVGLRI